VLFNFSLRYAIRQLQDNKDGSELVYVDDINLLGDSINRPTIKIMQAFSYRPENEV
jgi:hypothetical protein